MTVVLDFDALSKSYPGPPVVHALVSASGRIESGERVAIVGPSGSGKSTLLNVLGLLDKPTSGSYRIMGTDATRVRGRELDRLRATCIGFVFQAYHLIGTRTVTENLDLKLATVRAPRSTRRAAINDALDHVGLTGRKDALCQELSGGEKQRVALARAIVADPQLVLADEPTGNLDEANAAAVIARLDGCAERGIAVIVITHDPVLARWADRRLALDRGVLRA